MDGIGLPDWTRAEVGGRADPGLPPHAPRMGRTPIRRRTPRGGPACHRAPRSPRLGIAEGVAAGHRSLAVTHPRAETSARSPAP